MEFDRCGPVGALLAADQLDEMDVELVTTRPGHQSRLRRIANQTLLVKVVSKICRSLPECHQAQKGTHRFAPALLSVEVSKHTVNLS